VQGYPPAAYQLVATLNPQAVPVLQQLAPVYHLHLLSGDQPRPNPTLEACFNGPERIRYQQQPHDKLQVVQQLQANNHTVAMLGDGLNDAGALRQAHLGISVTNDCAQFTPASDAILHTDALSHLPRFLRLSRQSLSIIRVCFAVSVLYNLTGTFFAVQGELEPVVAAILMPLSSVGIIALSTGLTYWAIRRNERGRR
jgi:Cu+-exporting ATPase